MDEGERGTQADRALIAELAERGCSATPRQLKRWRQAGLLDAPVWRSAGRGMGRPNLTYPPEAVDQAAEIVDLLRDNMPLDEMAIAMLLRGAPVSIEAVRSAIHRILDMGFPDVDNVDETLDAVSEMVQRLVPQMRHSVRGPQLSRNVRRMGKRPGPIMEDGFTAMMSGYLTGTTPSPEGIRAMQLMMGIEPNPELEPALAATVEDLTLPRLRDLASQVTLDELTMARDLLLSIIPLEADAEEPAAPDYRGAALTILGLVPLARQQSHNEKE